MEAIERNTRKDPKAIATRFSGNGKTGSLLQNAALPPVNDCPAFSAHPFAPSAFRVQAGQTEILSPGNRHDVLLALNAAALKAGIACQRPGGIFFPHGLHRDGMLHSGANACDGECTVDEDQALQLFEAAPIDAVDNLEQALTAGVPFVACVLDNSPLQVHGAMRRAQSHAAAAVVEVWPNNALEGRRVATRSSRPGPVLFLEHGKPLVFGVRREKGVRLNAGTPQVVNLQDECVNELWVHDERDREKARLLVMMARTACESDSLPQPFGVFYAQPVQP